MSENESEGRNVSLDNLEYLEELVRDLKRRVVAAGDNRAVAAGSILDERYHLTLAISSLCNDAESEAEELSYNLYTLLDDYDVDYDTPDMDAFWNDFNTEVTKLKSASVSFRKKCLLCEVAGNTLFHEVCKRNPTAEVIETLIDLTPGNEDEEGREKMWGYPIHMIMEHGGSAEVVKLLVNADLGKKKHRGCPYHIPSLYRLLIASKEQHQPDEFSSIMRLIVGCGKLSSLLEMRKINPTTASTPLGMFWKGLKKSGLTATGILGDDDFIFLTKATCYQHALKMRSRHAEIEIPLPGYEGTLEEIGQIPLSNAFLVCSPYFDEPGISEGLKYLFSLDPSFLLEKDLNGQYPFHQMVHDHSSYHSRYFVDIEWVIERGHFMEFIISVILGLAPQCAKQVDDKGILPLHIAADMNKLKCIAEEERFELVRRIWNAYPDAAGIMDKETGLPPFALSMREIENTRKNKYSEIECCLSSAFFLLRKQPEILSEYIASGEKANQVPGCTPSKRQKVQQ